MRVILARAQVAQGKFDDAFENLRKVLAFDPKNIDALYNLSLLSKALAQRENQRLVSLAPDSYRVHQLLAAAALTAENKEQAEKEFLEALNLNPRSVEVLAELGELKRSQGKCDEALNYYTQAKQVGTLSYEIAYGIGTCFASMSKYREAIDWFEKAVLLAPDSAVGRFSLGNALFHNGQLEPAISELKASVHSDPWMRQAYLLLARAYSNLGRSKEAKAALQKVDELDRAELYGKPKSSSTSQPR